MAKEAGWLTYTSPDDSSSGMHEISIMGVIGWDVWVEDVRDALSSVDDSDDLKIDLHTPGGFYGDGVAIFSLLDRRSGMNHVEVIGEAGSMGSLIAMAGDRRTIRTAGTFYVHRPWAWMMGYEDDLREEADTLVKLADMMKRVYMRVYTGTLDELTEAMGGNGTTYTDEEAVSAGFMHEVIDGVSEGKRTNTAKKSAMGSKPPITTPDSFMKVAAMGGERSPFDPEHKRLSMARLRAALSDFEPKNPPPQQAAINELSRLERRMREARADGLLSFPSRRPQ